MREQNLTVGQLSRHLIHNLKQLPFLHVEINKLEIFGTVLELVNHGDDIVDVVALHFFESLEFVLKGVYILTIVIGVKKPQYLILVSKCQSSIITLPLHRFQVLIADLVPLDQLWEAELVLDVLVDFHGFDGEIVGLVLEVEPKTLIHLLPFNTRRWFDEPHCFQTVFGHFLDK